MMNSYFCSICIVLASKIDHSSNPLLSGDYHVNDKSKKFHYRPVNVQDIRDALAKAKASKSFGQHILFLFKNLLFLTLRTLWKSCLILSYP